MSAVPYPALMKLVTVEANLAAADIAQSGRFRAEVERQLSCTYDPKWIMTRWTKWRYLKGGLLSLTLPASDDPGLRGDNGQLLPGPVGYKIYLEPTSGDPIQTLKFTILRAADGPTIGLAPLVDLGGWPNAVILTPPPTTPIDPTPGDELQLVENPPGSGIWGLPTTTGS